MSAGTLPVYYWFVRSIPAKSQRFVRQFLIELEEARKANRLLSNEDPKNHQIIAELVEYDNYNRSTNDQASHEGRFRILTERFQGYAKGLQASC